MRALGLCMTVAVACSACSQSQAPHDTQMSGANAENGRQLMDRYGCGACHTIPGVRRATGLVGPQLLNLRRRVYIAGVVENTPENLVQWILSPQSLSPRTAMPDVGASEAEARDMAAYLYAQ
jgi:cytochrome c